MEIQHRCPVCRNGMKNCGHMGEWQLGYEIDNAYANADRYLMGSDRWHFWMDHARALENQLHGR